MDFLRPILIWINFEMPRTAWMVPLCSNNGLGVSDFTSAFRKFPFQNVVGPNKFTLKGVVQKFRSRSTIYPILYDSSLCICSSFYLKEAITRLQQCLCPLIIAPQYLGTQQRFIMEFPRGSR